MLKLDILRGAKHQLQFSAKLLVFKTLHIYLKILPAVKINYLDCYTE